MQADLLQVAMIGLWKSIQGYDPNRAKFSTYATMRIRGYMQDWLRGWQFVPRAERLKMESPPRLKNFSTEKWHIHSDLIGRMDPIAPIELREEVEKVLADCSELERSYIHARYWEGMEFREISARYGVSHQWVHFVIHRALNRLREQYADRR